MGGEEDETELGKRVGADFPQFVYKPREISPIHRTPISRSL